MFEQAHHLPIGHHRVAFAEHARADAEGSQHRLGVAAAFANDLIEKAERLDPDQPDPAFGAVAQRPADFARFAHPHLRRDM
jgi:hypothetical protein